MELKYINKDNIDIYINGIFKYRVTSEQMTRLLVLCKEIIQVEKIGDMLVVSKNGKYSGVVTPDEIINYLISHPDKLNEIVEEIKSA